VDCIRVDPPDSQPVPRRTPSRLAPIPVEPLSDDDQGDDSTVPF
jgi:hypothetical protein